MGLTDEARKLGIAKWTEYVDNPRAFVYDMFRTPGGRPIELEDYQVRIMEEVAAGHDVSVRSGHGVGKTTTDALTAIWFLVTRPYCRVPTTAPTFRQVKDILWAEIAKWYQNFRLRDHLELQSTKLSVIGHEAIWYAIGVSASKPENIEGFHAPHLLFIVDEAKGVQKGIFDSIDGALTTHGGQRLYTSTPGSRAGQFYESQHGRIARFFSQVHINGELSRRVSRAWREQKAIEWGIDSPIYQSKVLGEFPNEGDDILIRLDLILAAEAAALEEKCSKCGRLELCKCDAASVPAIAHGPRLALGLDVARYGMDESALAYGSANCLESIETWSKRDLVYTSDKVHGRFLELRAAGGCEMVGVDDTGLGGGVTDILISRNVPTVPIIFGSTALLKGYSDREDHFANNKAWLAWQFRKALEENERERAAGGAGSFAVPSDDKLKGQLSNIRLRHNNKGRVQIIDPDDPTIPVAELPKGVRVSPDRAHAAFICYHTATVSAAAGVMTRPSQAPAAKAKHRRYSSFVFGGRGRR